MPRPATNDSSSNTSNSNNNDGNNNDDSYKILYNVINEADNVGLALLLLLLLGPLLSPSAHLLPPPPPQRFPCWRCLSAYASPHNCVQFLRTKLKGLLLANFARENTARLLPPQTPPPHPPPPTAGTGGWVRSWASPRAAQQLPLARFVSKNLRNLSGCALFSRFHYNYDCESL